MKTTRFTRSAALTAAALGLAGGVLAAAAPAYAAPQPILIVPSVGKVVPGPVGDALTKIAGDTTALVGAVLGVVPGL